MAKVYRDFFPQAKALGIDVNERHSPSLADKVSCLDTVLTMFPVGEVAIEKLLDVILAGTSNEGGPV